jgi:hypothetical protein
MEIDKEIKGMTRKAYHRAYYWRNLEKRRKAARLSQMEAAGEGDGSI